MAMGRPTKYKKEFCIQAEKLCKKGFIDTEIADFFEVALSTLNKWKLDHKEFSESLKSGKLYSDEAVVSSLYGRALGYEFEERKVEVDAEKKEKVIGKVVNDFVQRLFGGDPLPLMHHLAKTGKISLVDIKELKKLIEKD